MLRQTGWEDGSERRVCVRPRRITKLRSFWVVSWYCAGWMIYSFCSIDRNSSSKLGKWNYLVGGNTKGERCVYSKFMCNSSFSGDEGIQWFITHYRTQI